MAELYGSSATTHTASSNDGAATTHDTKSGRYNGDVDDAVFAGKLVEVELGEDAERAAIRMKKEPRKRPGLGPDGKPWRSRMQRRNSADLARDQLVEQVLRETDVQCELPSYPHRPEPLSNMDSNSYRSRQTRRLQRLHNGGARLCRSGYAG